MILKVEPLESVCFVRRELTALGEIHRNILFVLPFWNYKTRLKTFHSHLALVVTACWFLLIHDCGLDVNNYRSMLKITIKICSFWKSKRLLWVTKVIFTLKVQQSNMNAASCRFEKIYLKYFCIIREHSFYAFY